jgi:hypothetical protein
LAFLKEAVLPHGSRIIQSTHAFVIVTRETQLATWPALSWTPEIGTEDTGVHLRCIEGAATTGRRGISRTALAAASHFAPAARVRRVALSIAGCATYWLLVRRTRLLRGWRFDLDPIDFRPD